MDAKETLLFGAGILDAVLAPADFRFELENTGQSSGGAFAAGSFVRGGRRLELHFRHSLGLVKYHIGPYSLDHSAYIRRAGANGKNQYPTFSNDPLEAFRALGDDIEDFCLDFLEGEGDEFIEFARAEQSDPSDPKGLKGLDDGGDSK